MASLINTLSSEATAVSSLLASYEAALILKLLTTVASEVSVLIWEATVLGSLGASHYTNCSEQWLLIP